MATLSEEFQKSIPGDKTSMTGNDETPASGTTAIVSRLKEFSDERRKNIRPWSEFFQTSSFKVPSPVSILPKRILSNLTYYLSNYVVVVFAFVLYCALNATFLLALMAIGAAWVASFMYVPDVTIAGRFVIDQRVRSVVLGVVTLIIFYYASVGNTIFWLVGASLTAISLHAIFKVSQEEKEGLNFDTLLSDAV